MYSSSVSVDESCELIFAHEVKKIAHSAQSIVAVRKKRSLFINLKKDSIKFVLVKDDNSCLNSQNLISLISLVFYRIL